MDSSGDTVAGEIQIVSKRVVSRETVACFSANRAQRTSSTHPSRRPVSVRRAFGVVLAEAEPIFRTAGKHAIGLGDAMGDEVVDQHADIGLGARRIPAIALLRAQCRVDAGEQPLRRSLFVAGRAVDLPSEEQPLRSPSPRVSASGCADRSSRIRLRSRGAADGHARARECCAPARIGRRTAGWSKSRSDRTPRYRVPPARERSDATTSSRSDGSCLRCSGNNAGRRPRSRRCTSASGRGCDG